MYVLTHAPHMHAHTQSKHVYSAVYSYFHENVSDSYYRV